jgi:hypothetical protein
LFTFIVCMYLPVLTEVNQVVPILFRSPVTVNKNMNLHRGGILSSSFTDYFCEK